MRNLKKFLALVLAMIMVVSTSAMVSADFTDVADSAYEDAINDLAVKGIIKGMTETTFGPKQDVNREQMAIFMARALTGDVESDDAWKKTVATLPFEDIANFEWQGAIHFAFTKGIIEGKDATHYYPADGIKYVEALAMAIRALGLDNDGDGNKLAWPYGYYNKAVELGLTDGMADDIAIEDALTREETAQIIYNLIWTEIDGDSIASKNFNIRTEDNADLFLVTGTPKQFHGNDWFEDYTKNDVDVDYFAVQPLVDGMATGRVYYIAAEELGVGEDEIEDYFFMSVELINFDEETGDFGAYIWGDEPEVVTNSDVSVKGTVMGQAGGVITIDGVDYYTINTTALSELRNNLAIYNSMNMDTYEAILLEEIVTDSMDNDVHYLLDVEGNRVALCVSHDALGNCYFYEYATGANISEQQALAKYGISWDNGVMWTTLLDKSKTDNAYELKLYDDDRDGLYERAVYVPVFMGVYDTYKVGNDDYDALVGALANTVMGDVTPAKAASVYYSDSAAKVKGAVSVYTYNPQLQEVTVLEVINPVVGTLEKVNATNNYKTVNVTVAGETFPIFFNNDKFADNSSYKDIPYGTLGANIIDKGAALYAGWNLEDNAKLAYLDHFGYAKIAEGTPAIEQFINRVKTGSTVMYYEYNGYIIMIDEIDNGILDDIAIIETPREFYYDGIYYDIITNGERVENAHITVLDGRDISGFTTYDFLFAEFLADKTLHYPGAIYFSNYGVFNGETYEFDIYLDTYAEFIADYGHGPLFVDARFLAKDATPTDSDGDGELDALADETGALVATGTINFNGNGIHTASNGDMIRTDANTVWYFIDTDAANPMNTKVDIHKGAAINETITFDAASWIWVDQTTNRASAANLIIVKDAVSTGIHTAVTGNTVIFASGVNVYETGTAAAFGLADNSGAYKGTYYKYTVKTLDMNTGVVETRDIFSKTLLSNDRMFEIDAKGVVVADYGWSNGNVVAKSVSAKYQTKKYNIQSVVGGSTHYIIDMNDIDAYLNGVDNTYIYATGSTTALARVPANQMPESLAGITSYLDLDKTANVVSSAGFVNGKFVATIHRADGSIDEITVADDITNVIVATYEGLTTYTGENAIKQLLGARGVSYLVFDNRADDANDAAFENHTMVFLTDPVSANGASYHAFEQIPDLVFTQYVVTTDANGNYVAVDAANLTADTTVKFGNWLDYEVGLIALDVQNAYNTTIADALAAAGDDWTNDAVQTAVKANINLVTVK